MAQILYKYLTHQHAESFVANGEVRFSSLSYFLACEHDERGDDLEGTRAYEPATGLEITKQTGEKLTWQGSFRSSVKEPDKLFICSMSTLLSPHLARELEYDACVEIADDGKFVARLRTALRREPRRLLKKESKE